MPLLLRTPLASPEGSVNAAMPSGEASGEAASSSGIVAGRFHHIIDLFRAELVGYGGLLNLLDLQQAEILDEEWSAADEVGGMIRTELRKLRSWRKRRKNLLSELMPDSDSRAMPQRVFRLFPPPMAPLVEALASEVGRLISRVRYRVLHNRWLRRRVVEVRSQQIETNSKSCPPIA